MKNSMEIKFKAIAENEAFARNVVASFILPLNPSINELEDITFALIYTDAAGKITNLAEGTLTNLPKLDEYLNGSVGLEGYDNDYNKAPYINFIWPRILLHASIALLLSGIVAVLFYLIWDTDEPQKNKKVTYKKKVIKNKK